jgi:hypothetical protein
MAPRSGSTRRALAAALAAVSLSTAAPLVPSAAAEPVAPTPAATTSALSNAPTGAAASGLDARAWVRWTAPSSPGGAITGYAITPIVDGSDLPTTTIASQATTGYVRNLPNGRVIRFSVAARTAAGVGARSAPSAPVLLPYGPYGDVVDGMYAQLVGRAPTTSQRSQALSLLTTTDDPGALVEAIRRGEAWTGSDAATVVDPVARLYFAYFLRAPDRSGLAYWIGKKRAGSSLYAISQSFASSSEFVRRYGELTNAEFVDLVYRNVLGRSGDAGGQAYWTRQLDQRKRNRGHVMAGFSESTEYQRKVQASVDVAVIWTQLEGAALSTTAFDGWAADLRSGEATLGDLVAAALGSRRNRDRWFCLDGPPETIAEQRQLLNHRDDRWRIGDNAKSVKLPDGRIVWIFADTLYGKVDDDGMLAPTGWGYTHSSALIQDDACIDPFYRNATPNPVSLIPDVSSTHFFWPESAWVDATGTTLWMLAGRRLGNPTTGGTDGGTVLAEFSLPDLTFQRIHEFPRPPRGKGLSWTAAMAHDGWIHLYTDNGPDPEATNPFGHFAARLPAAGRSFLDGTGWQYWNGSGWSASSSSLTSMTLPSAYLGFTSVVPTAGGFALITKPYFAPTSTAQAYSSTSPAGPWTKVGTVADLSHVPDRRTYLVHGEATVDGLGPFIVWSQSPAVSRSIIGAEVGVAAPLLPIP